MLCVFLDSRLKQWISNLSPFHWALASSLTYLGIQLVSPSTNLVKIYLERVVKKLQDLSLSLRTIRASWAGKIALVKMFLMPHILHLFRSIPTVFLQDQCSSLEQLIYLFIFSDKHSRVCCSILYAPTSAAELGAPEVKWYYKAYLLDQIKRWWAPSQQHLWLQIKEATIGSTPLSNSWQLYGYS